MRIRNGERVVVMFLRLGFSETVSHGSSPSRRATVVPCGYDARFTILCPPIPRHRLSDRASNPRTFQLDQPNDTHVARLVRSSPNAHLALSPLSDTSHILYLQGSERRLTNVTFSSSCAQTGALFCKPGSWEGMRLAASYC